MHAMAIEHSKASIFYNTMSQIFPVTYSTPSAEALKSVVQGDYQIGLVTDCRFLHRGLNDTFLVATETAKFIFRVYRIGWRQLSDILYELEVLLHLSAQDVSVSTPVMRKDGGFAGILEAPEGLRHGVLFLYVPGKEPALDIEPQSELYGRAVAKVHAKSETFSSSHKRFQLDLDHLLNMPVRTIKPFLSHRKDDWEYVKRLADKLGRRLEKLPLEKLEQGF